MITDLTTAFLLGVTITGALALVGGYWLQQSYRQTLAEERVARTRVGIAHLKLAIENYENVTKLERTEHALAKSIQSAADMETLLVVADAEIDRLTLGQPFTVADVIEFPAGGRG